jgi:thiol:disulfide interchange protein DsbD
MKLAALGFLLGLLGVTPFSQAAAPQGNDLDALLDQSKSAKSGDEFLSPDQAFQFQASPDGPGRITLSWVITKGYYLYRDRIKVASDSPQVSVGTPQFPEGVVKNDEYFGKQVIYHDSLVVPVPVSRSGPAGPDLKLKVTYQGCAEAGLCYPPQTRDVSLRLPGGTAAGDGGAGSAQVPAGGKSGTFVSAQDKLVDLLRTGSLPAVLLAFFGLGLVLAFTPCVLPMVPILSGLIVGQGSKITTSRAFLLSLTYVLGMAVTYTATGALAALAGKQVQVIFQQTWIIMLFAGLFVAMALSMFGLYTVQMPSFIQTRLTEASNRQAGGKFGGVAIMGVLSALIVTTCVGPALVSVLVVIGQTGDVARGSAALFVMALGMGAPLLVVGSSAGTLLPRAGAWMDSVKRLFGAMMLALAAWMLDRIVPARWSLLLFAVPAIATAVVLWGFVPSRRGAGGGVLLARAASVLVALYAVALGVGTARGSDDLLNPLAARSVSRDEPAFISVSSVADLQREVRSASAAHQPVMLDFYADWCTSCKEMQRHTFTDPKVREVLKAVRLLRADVTANNADDQALLHEFQIYGPPTIAFYDAQGKEHHEYRVVGYMKADEFAALLQQALTSG